MAEMKKNENLQQSQNVAVRQGRDTETTPARQQQQGYRSPWAMMRDMLRDPFGSMTPMGSELSTAFEVRETDDAFVFKADVPGIKKEDIEINLHGHRLTISGKRDQELEDRQNDRYYAYERSFGSFQRVFTLPEQVDLDHVRSGLDNGVLTVVVPKKPGPQPRKIEIGSGSKS